MRAIIKVILHVSKSPDAGIKIPKLDLDTTSLVVFSDAGLAGNFDLSSQIGFVIALVDGNGKANLLDYSSRKCRRITHSSLAGEIMALTAGFDAAFAIRHDLERITNRTFPLQVMTDSKGLFDMVTKSSYSAERSLMIDLATIRESYGRREIDEIAHIQGENNPADAMTKIVNSNHLLDLMRGRMTVLPEQWVVRASSQEP